VRKGREQQPARAEGDRGEHREPRAEPVDGDPGRDQEEARAEKPCREDRPQLREAEAELGA
jgi:hypothetical protein